MRSRANRMRAIRRISRGCLSLPMVNIEHLSDALLPARTATVKGVTAASDPGHPSKRAADTSAA